MIRFGDWKPMLEKTPQSHEPKKEVEDGTTLDSKIPVRNADYQSLKRKPGDR